MAKKRKKIIAEPIDTGAERLHHHHLVVPKLTRGIHGFNAKVLDETEIDRLLLADIINVNEHSTLERLLKRLHRVGMVGIKSPDYSAPISADASAVADRRAAALMGVTGLLRDMDDELGSTTRRRIVALVVEERPWPASNDALHRAITVIDKLMG